jgi:Ca2+-binding EF-hand superfamily protein
LKAPQQPLSSPGSRRQKQDAREEFSFNRRAVRVNLDLSPSSVKRSADAARERQSQKDLRTVFERLDIKGDKQIDTEEIEVLLKGLGYEPEPGEARDIIWEVDDRRHGGLTWKDFVSVYNRVRTDQYGMEPRRMYTIIEFCLFDLDASGVVGLNEV